VTATGMRDEKWPTIEELARHSAQGMITFTLRFTTYPDVGMVGKAMKAMDDFYGTAEREVTKKRTRAAALAIENIAVMEYDGIHFVQVACRPVPRVSNRKNDAPAVQK